MTKVNLEGVDFDKVDQLQRDPSRWVKDWKPPVVLPATWTIVEMQDDGAKYVSRLLELAAILTCSIEADGRA